MSDNFEKAIQIILGHEGNYVNHPSDPGGETIFGITKKVAVANGYSGAMKDMSLNTAKEIYKKQYWLKEFDEMDYRVSLNVFDGAVNSGVKQSVKWLQRAVGVDDDGVLGPKTLAAVKSKDPNEVVMLFNAVRLEFLTLLSTFNVFGKGWTRRIASNLKLSGEVK